MKFLSRIIHIAVSVVIMAAALLFLFLELRLIFSGDWLLHEIPVLAFIRYFLRALIAGAVFSVGLAGIVAKNRSFLFESVCILVSCLAMAPFLTNGFGLYFSIAAALPVLSNIFEYAVRHQRKSENNT